MAENKSFTKMTTKDWRVLFVVLPITILAITGAIYGGVIGDDIKVIYSLFLLVAMALALIAHMIKRIEDYIQPK